MSVQAFTDEWAKRWAEELNASPSYKAAAGTWEWPLVLKLERDPSIGIQDDRWVYLDLYRGQCREARLASADDLAAAPFVISAAPHTWKQVFDRQLDPLTGMMRGQLKLEKGDMSVLMQYVIAAKELVDCSLKVDAVLPGGL
jgi:putative sterol carrier protein